MRNIIDQNNRFFRRIARGSGLRNFTHYWPKRMLIVKTPTILRADSSHAIGHKLNSCRRHQCFQQVRGSSQRLFFDTHPNSHLKNKIWRVRGFQPTQGLQILFWRISPSATKRHRGVFTAVWVNRVYSVILHISRWSLHFSLHCVFELALFGRGEVNPYLLTGSPDFRF